MRPTILTTTALSALLGCTNGPDTTPVPDETDASADTDRVAPVDAYAGYTLLAPHERLTRLSVALRGIHPSAAERAEFGDSLEGVRAAARAWVNDPRFGTTIRQMYAEVLRLRSDEARYPPIGTLTRKTIQEMGFALSEEPLRLIERVVMEGRPFTEIVTADTTVLDATAAKIWSGHAYDPDGPAVQEVAWTDGRPGGGILSTNALWARHVSNGNNYHRGRANLIADALLCEDFLARDVPITGDVDLSDDEAVAQAISTRPACVSCHQSLDPLGAHLWVFHPEFTPAAVFVSDATGCSQPFLDLCYPFDPYRPELAVLRPLLQLRPPGFYGKPTDALDNLGDRIAEDPRFAQCTVRRLWSFLGQTDLQDTPFEPIAALQQSFVDSGYDAQQLAVDIVTHPAFLATQADDAVAATQLTGPLLVRPDQHAAIIADLTGFSYTLVVDSILSNPVCATSGVGCYGDVELATDDTFGFRSMTGGVDGLRVTHPTHTPTPVKMLFAQALAEEAAAWVVQRDLREGASPTLLTLVNADSTLEDDVRAQLAALHLRILSEDLGPQDPRVDASWALWSDTFTRTGRTRSAWRVTLAAMLQAPNLLFY